MTTVNGDGKDSPLVKTVRNKRLIFTVTTGRSGTAYLTAVFNYMRNVSAHHEPAPEYVNVLREVQSNPDLARDFVLQEKIPAIAQSNNEIYIETSHLTCKGFLEHFLDLDIIPDLVIHRRPMRDVSLSLLNLGTIPGREEKAMKFYLQPTDPGVLQLPDWQTMTDYQLCYWYCLEIERRAKEYSALFSSKGARVVETTLAGLKTVEGLDELLHGLDLQLKFPAFFHRLRYVRNSNFKQNRNRVAKKDMYVPENIDEQEAEVCELARL